MTIFLLILFMVAALGTVALFGLKYWEESRGRVLAQALRQRGDERALALKRSLEEYRQESRKLGPKAVLVGRWLLHEGALGLAALARGVERQAHRLADMVSYKHTFQRRETRSHFLRQVSEYKTVAAPQQGLDTTY